LALAIFLEAFFFQDRVEQFPVGFRKNSVGRRRVVPFDKPLERPDSPAHALAIAGATFAAHLDLKDRLLDRLILDNLHVAIFEAVRLVRPQARIGHEQHVVVKLFRLPIVAGIFRVGRPRARGAGRAIRAAGQF
jgi:hypothetical protein